MKNKLNKKIRLYATMFKVGCIGFGGGSALVPVIEKEVVDNQKAITKDDYNKDVVVASVTPGALPMEVAAGVGKRCFGTRGMFFSGISMSIPGAIMTLLLLTVMSGMNDAVLQQIEFLSIGITAFISCMLTGYITDTLKTAGKSTSRRMILTILIVVGVCILTMGKSLYGLLEIDFTPVFGLSTIQVLAIAFFVIFYTKCKFDKVSLPVTVILVLLYILTAAKRSYISNDYIKWFVWTLMIILGIKGFVADLKSHKVNRDIRSEKLSRELLVWIFFVAACAIPAVFITFDTLELIGRGLFSSILSFGGGDSYLIMADGLMVQSGLISEAEFYGTLVTVVNILPGSILCKTLTGIGYFVGYNVAHSQLQGCLVALAAYACSVAASGGVFCLGFYVFRRFDNLSTFSLLKTLIKPIISGLLITVMLTLMKTNADIGSEAAFGRPTAIIIMLAFLVLNLVLSLRYKKSNVFLIVVSALGSLALCNLLQFIL